MADTRLKELQNELVQKELILKKINSNKNNNKHNFFYSLSELFSLESDDEKIKKLEKEIEDLKIKIDNSTPFLDKIKNTVDSASQTFLKTFTPTSVVKSQQMEQLQKNRETAEEMRLKYGLTKKS